MNKKHEWFIEFEEKFNIIPNTQSNEMKVIIGETAYRQVLNNTPLAVFTQNINYSKLKNLYSNFNEIAFLVNDWIKVQDTLEMIFNLLVGSSNSIQAIAFLKSHSISPEKFASYLWEKHRILLINEDSIINNINLFTELNNIKTNYNIKGDVYCLILGNTAYDNILNNLNNSTTGFHLAKAIHPSGLNLGNSIRDGSSYYGIWYQQNDNYLFPPNTTSFLARFKLK